MLLNIQAPLICLCSLPQLHTALPLLPLTNPSLSIQNPAASNLSKPMYPPPYTQPQAHTDISPTSYDTFSIPNTDLVINFSSFGPILNILELNDLLTRAQDDLQTLINRHGADTPIPDDGYDPWRNQEIALEVYRVSTSATLTLGQFHSLIEGLWLYMIQERRYVSSESLFPFGDKILSFETRLGSLYSRNMFNSSKEPLN